MLEIRRPLAFRANRFHSRSDNMHVKMPLYMKYMNDSRGCARLAMRTLATKVDGPFVDSQSISVRTLTAPRPSLQRVLISFGPLIAEMPQRRRTAHTVTDDMSLKHMFSNVRLCGGHDSGRTNITPHAHHRVRLTARAQRTFTGNHAFANGV